VNKKLLMCPFVILLLLEAFAGAPFLSSGARTQGDGIIVAGGDDVSIITNEYSAEIANVTSGVTSRVVVEYGDFGSKLGLNRSSELDQAAGAVSSRVSAEYADSVFGEGLQDVRVPDIASRIMVEYADSVFGADLEPISWVVLPDFSIAASQTSLTIQQGNSGSSTITITSMNGFNQPVQLTKSGVPSGVTATLDPQQVTPPAGGSTTSTLTVSVSTTATPGSCTLTVTGTNGTLSYSTYISLEITALSPAEWTFAIITDLHIGRGYKELGHGSNYNGENYYLTDRLQTVVKWIIDNAAANNIKFVVVLGDLTEDGTEVEMNKAKEILNPLSDEGNIPYFPVIGNHDHSSTLTGTGQDDEYFDSVFNTTFFNIQHAKLGAGCTRWVDRRMTLWNYRPVVHLENYAFQYQGKNFVFLDFVDRLTNLGMPTLETETMDFLREQLNWPEPTVLFSHHPMIESKSNFHQGIRDDTWTDLNGNITSANAKVLANFAGHIHGYYDPEKLFNSMAFSDAETALDWQEDHPSYTVLHSPYFYNASYNYKGSQFATAGDIPVITTEAIMVGSNTNAKNGIIRIVSVTGDGFNTWTPEDTAFPSLNPYIISATTSVHWSGNLVNFTVYAFTKMFNTTHPIEYSLYVDGEFRKNASSYAVERVKFDNQELTRGTHEVNLTVVGYAPDGRRIVESIKRTVIVGRLFVHLECPADIVVTDPVGRSIGKQMNEILNATYTEADLDGDGDLDKFVEILAPIDGNYVFTLNGTDLGSYSMIAQFATSQEVVSFNATEIPASLGAVHQYAIDWAALLQGGEGVTVQADSDGDGAYEHTFFSGAVLTGDEFAIGVGGPVVESCNSTGTVKDSFDSSDSVYVKGEGYQPSATYDLYVVNATTWSDGMSIPQRVEGTATTITSDTSGNITVTPAWNTPITMGNYDIVVDANRDGYYNSSIDALDQSNVQIKAGFQTVPEFSQTTILIALMITTISATILVRKKRYRNHHVQHSSKRGMS